MFSMAVRNENQRRQSESPHQRTELGVDDTDYQPPFRFSGKVDKLTVKLVPLKATEEKLLQQKAQETKNKAQ